MKSRIGMVMVFLAAFTDLEGQKAEGSKFEGRSWDLVCEVFSLPLLEAVELKRAGKSDEEDYAELVKRVAAGAARQEEFLMSLVREGEATKLEEIAEVIYASSYDPPELPNKVGKLPENLELAKNIMTPAGPTAFDTRKVGTMLEVEISREGEGVVGVSAQLRLVNYLGRQVFGQGAGEIEMPRFAEQNLTVRLKMKLDSATLMGSMKPLEIRRFKGGERRVLLAFVTVLESQN